MYDLYPLRLLMNLIYACYRFNRNRALYLQLTWSEIKEAREGDERVFCLLFAIIQLFTII